LTKDSLKNLSKNSVRRSAHGFKLKEEKGFYPKLIPLRAFEPPAVQSNLAQELPPAKRGAAELVDKVLNNAIPLTEDVIKLVRFLLSEAAHDYQHTRVDCADEVSPDDVADLADQQFKLIETLSILCMQVAQIPVSAAAETVIPVPAKDAPRSIVGLHRHEQLRQAKSREAVAKGSRPRANPAKRGTADDSSQKYQTT
jgi:hypothetical protein